MKIPWRKILIGELSWKRFGRSALIIYALLFFGSYFFSERLIFPYRGTSYDSNLPGLELLRSPDGETIASRHLKAPNETHLILHFHGNYEDIGQLDPLYEELRAQGWSILTMDYRGYGLSTGNPKETNCYQDADLLYQRALELGYKPEKIIIWGRSVGGGLAVELAKEREARALVLESAFATAFRTATHVPIVPFDRFHNLSKIGDVKEPLFVIHGDNDTVIPDWHSENLFLKHPGPKERHLIKGAGHNDLWDFPLDTELEELKKFLTDPKTNG